MDAKNPGYPEKETGASGIFCNWPGRQPVSRHLAALIRRWARNRKSHLDAPHLGRYFQDPGQVGIKSDAAANRRHAGWKNNFISPALRHRPPAGIRRRSRATSVRSGYGLSDHRPEDRSARLAVGERQTLSRKRYRRRSRAASQRRKHYFVS